MRIALPQWVWRVNQRRRRRRERVRERVMVGGRRQRIICLT